MIIKYRLSFNKTIIIKRELIFQVIDLGQGAFIRTNIFEYVLKNRRIFTIDKNGKTEWFFISQNDFKKCWYQSSYDLKNKKAKLLTIETKKLLFGGYSFSKVKKIEYINKKPILRK